MSDPESELDVKPLVNKKGAKNSGAEERKGGGGGGGTKKKGTKRKAGGSGGGRRRAKTAKGTKAAAATAEEDEEEEEYQVESIVDKKEGPAGFLYLVKWVGWAAESNTWEPVENLDGCPELLAAFEEIYARKRAEVDSEAASAPAPAPQTSAKSTRGQKEVLKPAAVAAEIEIVEAESAAAGAVASTAPIVAKQPEPKVAAVGATATAATADSTTGPNSKGEEPGPGPGPSTSNSNKRALIHSTTGDCCDPLPGAGSSNSAPTTNHVILNNMIGKAPGANYWESPSDSSSDEEPPSRSRNGIRYALPSQPDGPLLSGDAEDYEEYEVLTECPDELEPKELVGVVQINQHMNYLVEWGVPGAAPRNIFDPPADRRLIRSLPFKLKYAPMVIKFYEDHINFTTESQDEEEDDDDPRPLPNGQLVMSDLNHNNNTNVNNNNGRGGGGGGRTGTRVRSTR